MEENSTLKASGNLNRMIQDEVKDIFDRLEPIRSTTKYPHFSNVNIPMVLVLGNHSSGKSTFINYMLGKKVQKTGRAPTDSTFTVICGGERSERLDGHALCRSKKFGLSELPNLFGHNFVSQLELKVIEDSDLLNDSGIMLVDSPGMIDPPGKSHLRTDQDRGYNFKKVVQWFANRADVILVMFDPDKPGTTFETLDILTSCLNEFSSKLLLILNKVDDFRSVHDFARAYGALCWNLSKMIPRKDMPFIYAMYSPQDDKELNDNRIGNAEEMKESSSNRSSIVTVLKDILAQEFDGTREEVITEIKRAPDRSTDNLLSGLKETCSRLEMHCRIIEACRKKYEMLERRWKYLSISIGVCGTILAIAYVIRYSGRRIFIEGSNSEVSKRISSTPISTPPASSDNLSVNHDTIPQWKREWAKEVSNRQGVFRWLTLFKIIGTTAISVFSSIRFSRLNLKHKQETILDWLPDIFREKYLSSHRKSDDMMARWSSVRPALEDSLSSFPLNSLPLLEDKHQEYLSDVLNIHIPRLDRCARDRSGDDYAYLSFKYRDKSLVD